MNNLNYGVIGNGRSAALISLTGSIDWCCFPDFDSPSVFAKILDPTIGGSCSFLVPDHYQYRQKYLERTNILKTEFFDAEHAFEVLDFMPRYKTEENSYYTPPEIYRYIRVNKGNPIIKIEYAPRLNYAAGETKHKVNHEFIRSVTQYPVPESIYLYSSLDLQKIYNSEEIALSGEQFLLISYHQKVISVDIQRVYLEYQRTKVYWLNWVNRSRVYNLYNEQIQRSLLVLKLLSYQKTGATLAAVTTSLPEAIGEQRNWDYRYCWLRDSSMTLETLIQLGHFNAAKRYIAFLKSIIRSKEENFQIMYGIRMEKNLEEKILPHLAGYENSRPVRIGNAAYSQEQHDIYGFILEVILQYYIFFTGTLDEVEEIWSITRSIVRHVEKIWMEPDCGIWEFRGEKQQFVFSKMLCWVAINRGIRVANLLNKKDSIAEWTLLESKIRQDIETNGWNEKKKSFVQVYGKDSLDASLLLMEQFGFIKAHDERYISTVEAIQKELKRDGLMYRYKCPDDFGMPRSAFTVCTFWLVKSLFVIGRKEEAKELFDEILTYSNHLGLFSEDIDFKTKRLLGNFPQAYSHLALIQTAILFSHEKQRLDFVRP